jgi:acyl-CoA thioesterase FadM
MSSFFISLFFRMNFASIDRGISATRCPLSPFTDWKSGVVDVLALSRASTFVRRAAMQNGLVPSHFQAAKQKAEVDPDGGAEDSSTLVPFHGFMASSHVVLVTPSLDGLPIEGKTTFAARVILSALGKSSYSVAASLHFEDETRSCIGLSQVTLVRIDPATRRPTPIDPARREHIEQNLRSEEATAAGFSKLERLVEPPLGKLLREESFVVRYADIDFNDHLNQSLYTGFVLDTVRLMKLDLTEKHPNPASGTDVKEIRMDHLKEIRGKGSQVTCSIFEVPTDASRIWFRILNAGAELSAQGFIVLQ